MFPAASPAVPSVRVLALPLLPQSSPKSPVGGLSPPSTLTGPGTGQAGRLPAINRAAARFCVLLHLPWYPV